MDLPTPQVFRFYFNGEPDRSPLNVGLFGEENEVVILGSGFLADPFVQFLLASGDVRLYDFRVEEVFVPEGETYGTAIKGKFKAKGFGLFWWWRYEVLLHVYNAGTKIPDVVPKDPEAFEAAVSSGAAVPALAAAGATTPRPVITNFKVNADGKISLGGPNSIQINGTDFRNGNSNFTLYAGTGKQSVPLPVTSITWTGTTKMVASFTLGPLASDPFGSSAMVAPATAPDVPPTSGVTTMPVRVRVTNDPNGFSSFAGVEVGQPTDTKA